MNSFWGSTILFKQTIINRINKFCWNFFGGITEDTRRMVFTRWDDITAPWEEGRLNVKDDLSWNKALRTRWIFETERGGTGLWQNWIKAYVLKNDIIWQLAKKDWYPECIVS